MTALNKQALREAAQEATGAHARLSVMPADDISDILQHEGTQLNADITALNAFNEAANPATVLALLDELEATEKRIAELEARQVDLEHIGYIQVEEGVLYLDEGMVKSAICAAGIRINGED